MLSQKQKEQLETYNDEPEIKGVYVGEEGIKKLEEEQKNKIQLPPYPDGLFDWTEDDEKLRCVPEDVKQLGKVAQHKLLLIWDIWGNVRTNEKLIELINKNLGDQKTDEFFLKQFIVHLVDIMGKILNGKTDITEDIFGRKL